MFADRPVLVYFDIVSRNNPNDVGIDIPYCDIVQAEKAVSMGQAIANNNFSDEIFNREPGEGDGLTTPCGRFVIPAKQFVQ
jgi:hypothetical protein